MSVATDKAREIFSQNLRYYMDKKGVTQSDLVAYLNCSKSAMSQWYNGKRSMPAVTGQKIAEYLGITLNDLVVDRSPLSRANLKFALFGGNATEEQLDEVLEFAKWVKNKGDKDV